MPFFHHGDDAHKHEHHLPHIGMRKVKSVLAVFVGFWVWQGLRLLMPGLEVHPIFIYIYGMIEIRESSDQTINFGRMRIKATVTAIVIGLPFMLLTDGMRPLVAGTWMKPGLEIAVLVIGALLVLCAAEAVKCQAYVGLSAAIYVILMISHFESSVYLYSLMRAFQTVIGVVIAWFINVKLLPYPPKPGTLSDWIAQKTTNKEDNTEKEKA